MRVTGFIGSRRQRRGGLRPQVFLFCLLPSAFCLLAAVSARGQYAQPPVGPVPTGNSTEVLKKVGIEQRLGGQIPLDLSFRDESGRAVRLGEYFKAGKPVVLTLVYYECPMLCNQTLNGLVGALEAVPFTPGKDFEIVAVSFDPREGPDLAARKKETYLRVQPDYMGVAPVGKTGAGLNRLDDFRASGVQRRWAELASPAPHCDAHRHRGPRR